MQEFAFEKQMFLLNAGFDFYSGQAAVIFTKDDYRLCPEVADMNAFLVPKISTRKNKLSIKIAHVAWPCLTDAVHLTKLIPHSVTQFSFVVVKL